jgi:hypothetical protein
LEREVANLTDAIAGGVLRTSPALAQKLRTAEDELSRLRKQLRTVPADATTLIPRFADLWREKVSKLEVTLAAGDIARARTELVHALGGEIQVVTTAKEIRLETKKGALEGAFLRAAGGQQINLVAGA